MNVSLDLYKIFCTVADEGSISDAARTLFISQPAVSQAVRRLEQELGVRLFDRGAKGVVLTREGELLRGYVASAMGMLEAGESRMRMLSKLDAGELRIGASDTVSKWFLVPIIHRFHDMYPNISLSITNRTTTQTLELLQSGSIDIGYVNLPAEVDGMVFEECMPVHDVFVASQEFSELRGRTVSPAELARHPLIMLEEKANSRRWVNRHFRKNGVILDPGVELGAHDLLLDFAGIGLGIACVIREFAGDALKGELFEIDLQPPVPRRAIGVCYNGGINLSPAAQKLIELSKPGSSVV